MAVINGKPKWRVLNKSIRGAAHERNNIECQDYTLCQMGEDGAVPIILTAADGHGGKRYTRSAQGAVYACETAASVAAGYIGAVLTKTDAKIVKQLAETRIKLDIIKKWRQLVLADVKKTPFTDRELELLDITREQFEDIAAKTDIDEKEKLFRPYGTTLLYVIILEDYIICGQIGDGDIMFLDEDNKVVFPIEKDEALFANETTSLCSLRAPFHFRHNVSYLYDKENIPKLIMLATDGYSNSFIKDEDYHQAASDYYSMLTGEGMEFVKDNMEAWLKETSKEGSGDDITIALAWQDKEV